MATSWGKKERENKKKEERKKKEEKKRDRKENSRNGNSLDDMMAYLDEYGNLTSVPPDTSKKIEVSLDDIEIGVPKQQKSDVDKFRREGVVTYFNSSKGFGFIEDSQNGQRLFVHQSSSEKQLNEGLKVTFESEKGPRGYTAVKVLSN